MSKHCHSCGGPMGNDQGPETRYCACCTDEHGKLLPRETIQAGIASWLKQWAPEGEEADFVKRAENYMKAMPAWAGELLS